MPPSAASSPRLLVTGAANGIGAAVMAEAQVRGIDAVGLEGVDRPLGRGVSDPRVRWGVWTDRAWLQRALDGVSAVIHTVADARPRASYDELAPINLDVAEALYGAAARAGAGRFILVSRARLVAASERYATEESEPRPHNAFEQTLYDAEVMLRGLAHRTEGGPSVVVLRTAPVYGFPLPPPSSPWLVLPPLFALYFDLLPGLSGGPRCHWAHLEDVAAAAVHLATFAQATGGTIHVADDTPVTLGEFYNALVEAYGYPLGIKVPYPGEALLARLRPLLEQPMVLNTLERVLNQLWVAAHASREGGEPSYHPSLAEVPFHGLFEEAVFDNARLKATGFGLRHPDLRQGVRQMIAEYQRAGELPRPRARAERTDARRPGVGTHFSESMAGHWAPPGGGARRQIRFQATLSTPGIHLPVSDRLWNLDGRLWAEGLASDARIEGTLDLAPRSKRQLIYEFGLVGDDGHAYRVEGIKSIRWRDPVRSFTEMDIWLRDDHGQLVGTGRMAFDLKRDLFSLLRSYGIGRLAAPA